MCKTKFCDSIFVMLFIFAQVFGFVSAILSYSKLFLKKKGSFLLLQTVSTIFSALSYIFLNSYVAGIVSAVSILRCLYLYLCDKFNFKWTKYFLPIFIVAYIVIGVVFWKNALDIIPIITSTIFTIAYYVKDLQYSRIIILVPNTLLAIFSFLTFAYTNACKYILEIVIAIIAIVKFHNLAKNSKEKSLNQAQHNETNT